MDFQFHAEDSATQTAIQSQQWTHVILQNYSTQPTHLASGSIDDHNTFGAALYDQVIANNADTQVVLYETFSRSAAHSLITGTSSPTSFASTAEFQEELRVNYAALADSLTSAHPDHLPVQVAPVGSAWENAGGMLASTAEGYVDLHSRDEYHGNDNGYYLAACVFYSTIYGKSPEGLSVTAEVQALNLSLTEDAAALESAAWETVEPQISKLEAGQILRIDFGADTVTMDEGDDGANTWNNVTAAVGGTDDGVVEGLLTTTGTATNVNLEMLSRFNGANTAGTTTSTVFPSDATSDSLFGNTEEFGGVSDVFPSFRVTGLNPANTYTFTFFASRGGVGDNRQTRFTVTGDDEEVTNLNASNNENEAAILEGVIPGDDGVITISISPGADNDNANHFTYLGALQIEGPALPVTEVLFDFGADAIQMEEGDDDDGNTWNNVVPAVGGVDGGMLEDIVSSSGGETSLGLTMVNRFNGANTAGSTATDLFPVDATNDSLFGNTELFGGLENVFPSFTLTGLDPAQAHSFTFFASRMGVGDNRETMFTLTGANTASAALDPANNETEFITLEGLLPTADGEITVALTPGENNDNGNHFTYLGVMKVIFAGSGGGQQPDTTAPELTSTSVTGNILTLEFNEPLDAASVGALSNYTVTADGDPVLLDGAELDPGGTSILIELADTFIGQYTVTVSGVTDVAGNAVSAGSSINGVAPDPDAQFFLFDFGGGNFIEEDEVGNVWNNVTNGVADADEGILFDILDNSGSSTDLEIEMIRRFNGVNTSGTLDNPDFPGEATGDSFYGNTEAFGVGPDIFPAFKFTGLDPLKAYAFTFYASRMGATDNRETGYTLTGANSGFVALNPAENIDQSVTVQAMVPTAEGEITIEIGPTENNNNGNHFTYLGILRMDVTEPVAGLKITEHPQSVSVNELEAVSFLVAVEGEPPFTFQWFRNGESIDGATSSTYAIDSAAVSLSGSMYTVAVSNAGGSITSDPATLTVIPDQTIPELNSSGSDGATVTLVFSEILDKASAETTSNYTVAGSVVSNASLSEDGLTVTLTLATPLEGEFTIGVGNVTDRAGNGLAEGTEVTVTAPIAGQPTFYFDFGGNGTTEDDDPARSWNSVTNAIGSDEFGELIDIVDSTGAVHDVTLLMISRFNGTNTNGTTAHPAFPASATGDSLYGNTAEWNALVDIFPSFQLTDLDPSLEYTFTMFASRLGAGEPRETGYTVVGANELFGALDPSNNEVNTVAIGPVAPDADGAITISIAPTENNLNANEFTYLGLMQVDTAPAGASGGGFAILSIDRGDDDSTVLIWTSSSNATYAIETSDDLVAWDEAEDGIVSGGDTTTYVVPASVAGTTERYFRVLRE